MNSAASFLETSSAARPAVRWSLAAEDVRPDLHRAPHLAPDSPARPSGCLDVSPGQDKARMPQPISLRSPHGINVVTRKPLNTTHDLPLMGAYHPESIYPVKAPTAQLTRIDAAYRLFSVPLTRITSVPECAVSSVGFLWGSAAVSPTCGVSVGLAEAPDCPADPTQGTRYRNSRRLMITFRVT